MDRQAIFDRVITHLIEQGSRATRPNGDCSYLTDDGRRCAIGALIPDGHEGLYCTGSSETLLEEHPDLRQAWGVTSPKDRDLLAQLQYLHDNPKNWDASGLNEAGRAEASRTAADFRLDASVLSRLAGS